MALLIVTGASGVGKSTVAEYISASPMGIKVLYFDSIGVPTEAEMIRQYGSGSDWQQAMTIQWLQRIKSDYGPGDRILLEGSTQIAFITDALAEVGLKAKIVLIHCSDAVRSHRLVNLRKQPELDNPDMRNWAAYLHREAVEGGHGIVDTSEGSVAEAAARVVAFFGN